MEKVSPNAQPSHLIGATAYWFIFLFAISAAIGALQIAALTSFITQVRAFLPNIIVAILIFVVAAVLAGAVAGVVQKLMGDTPTKVVTAVVPGLILATGLFMVLNQLKIAEEIVLITYAAVLGMLARAGALAFGLGGRDVAAQMLQGAYESGQRNKDQIKRDWQTAQERGQQQAQQAQASMQGSGDQGNGGQPSYSSTWTNY